MIDDCGRRLIIPDPYIEIIVSGSKVVRCRHSCPEISGNVSADSTERHYDLSAFKRLAVFIDFLKSKSFAVCDIESKFGIVGIEIAHKIDLGIYDLIIEGYKILI